MADTRTIEIVVKTDKAQKNVKDLGGQLDKTKGNVKQYQSQIGDSSKATGGMIAMGKRLLPILGAMAAAFKGMKAVIQTNVDLSLALERAQAGLGAVAHTVTADIGALAAELFKVGEGQSFASKATEIGTGLLTNLSRAFGVVTAEVDIYNIRLQENIRIAEAWVQLNHDLRLASSSVAVQVARLNTEFQKARFNARDETNDLQTRLESQAKAEEVLRQRMETQTFIQKERIRLAKVFYDGTEEGTRQREEAFIKIEQELVKLAQIETSYYTESRTLVRDGIRLQNELNRTKEQATITTQQQAVSETALHGVTTSQLKTQQQLNAELAERNQLVQQGNDDQAESNALGAESNVTLQQTVGIVDQFINLFSNFSFRSFLGILFNLLSTGASIAASVSSGGAFSFLSFLGIGEKGGVIPFAKGGLLQGPSHAQGGIKYAVGGNIVELEGGEGVINKKSMSIPWVKNMASDLNQMGGGVKFANGGITPNMSNGGQVFVPVLVTDDLNAVQNRTRIIESIATI